MKRYLILLIPALVLLGSCEREKNLKDGAFSGKVSIIPNRVTTRGAADGSTAGRNLTLQGGGAETLRVKETVRRSDAPATRGAVITTETVAEAYPSMTVAAYSGGELVDGEVKTFSFDGSSKYVGHYTDDPWANGAVDFFMLMGSGVTPTGYSSGSFSFSYSSPATAASQEDILFSSRAALTKSTYDSEESAHEGASALFCHALTGIEFALDNESETTSITSITVKGLYGEGTCTYTAGGETPAWSTSGSRTSFTESANPTGDAFWFIPQAITSDLLLDITYTCDGVTETRTDLRFGEALLHGAPGLVWEAGEIRTYTLVLKPYDVIIVFDHSENLSFTAREFSGETDWTVFHNLSGSWYYLHVGEFKQITVHGSTSNGSDKWIEFGSNPYYIQEDGTASTTRYSKKKGMIFKNVILYQNNASYLSSIQTLVNGIIDDFAEDREINRVALISFNDGASTLAGFTTLTAGNVTTLHNAVNGVTTSGTTMADWSAGLQAAQTILSGIDRESKRLVFFITGSNPSNTNETRANAHNPDVAGDADEAATAMKRGATIYAIWIDGTPDSATAEALNDIASSGSYSTGPVNITF